MEKISPPLGGTCVSVIDVGKGDCILLQTGESAALIDTGYDSTSGVVLDHLRRQGVTHLDFVIITHYDRDHVGGLRDIGSEIAIDTIYLPEYIGADKNYRTLMAAIEHLGRPAQRVTEKLSLKLGDALVTVLPSNVEYNPHGKGNEGNDNDLSLVASLIKGGDSYLFAGDLEKDGLAAYLDDGHGGLSGRGHFDVLKEPCHGRKCSLTDEFFEDVKPHIAIITDSKDDRADKKVLKQLKEVGAETYCTGVSGTIVVTGNGTGVYSVLCS